MNAARRKTLGEAEVMLRQAQEIISDARDEEQEYYDNMPESIQSGGKGDAAMEIIELLEQAADAIEQFCDDLAGVVQ